MPFADLAKIPLLIGLLWSQHVTYSPPNPFAHPEPDAKGEKPVVSAPVRVMRRPWHRKLFRVCVTTLAPKISSHLGAKATVRTVLLCEIIAVLATEIPTSLSTYILPVLDLSERPGTGASRIRITPTFAVGWLLAMAGGLLRIVCYRTMGRHFTFEITVRKDHRLITSGPYSIVRHPSYSALLLVVLGSVLCFYGSGSWLRECGILDGALGKAFGGLWLADLLYVPVVALFFRVRVEDELLHKAFGSEWEAWVRKTPYAIMPGIY
ncbi:hypothetical protein BN946_scf184884.g12 [Trametes cinnabarina]|uniref:Protein-S-isoprenylcysteine O-methyltransferase n=1 Tax=Pycnoporus cinnabarinus TaxID=5643 RepID=A0A060SBV7_PYCCI|nr:hypothetical protein BN946_scf184884.g12 [Trametes cinnabarina]